MPKITLRTPKHEASYKKRRIDGQVRKLSSLPAIKKWQYWRLTNNDYPYDLTFGVHHMLVLYRRSASITLQEMSEFLLILNEIQNDYDCVIYNFPHLQSVNNHFHVHLLIYKEVEG